MIIRGIFREGVVMRKNIEVKEGKIARGQEKCMICWCGGVRGGEHKDEEKRLKMRMVIGGVYKEECRGAVIQKRRERSVKEVKGDR